MAHLPHSYEGKYSSSSNSTYEEDKKVINNVLNSHALASSFNIVLPPSYPSSNYKKEQVNKLYKYLQIIEVFVKDKCILTKPKNMKDNWYLSFLSDFDFLTREYKPVPDKLLKLLEKENNI